MCRALSPGADALDVVVDVLAEPADTGAAEPNRRGQFPRRDVALDGAHAEPEFARDLPLGQEVGGNGPWPAVRHVPPAYRASAARRSVAPGWSGSGQPPNRRLVGQDPVSHLTGA